ncbi:hypothetical protein Pan216_24890 [Planctomycetes bacterium Pan216]|uniref:Activator of Hsp90 ATPase homologue 1/2-like C-terminal domain-containing protein n=1 Tax=Kolteria novifilia TaxID=2527975 RepID=A0A518B3Q2_9BACT|nr:hypothetical protein Pan216_24890 [Planctomycetes bacterium Pan216]
MTNNANVSAESTPELVVTRTFDAPRELVWKAWTEREHLLRWSCPKDFAVTYAEGDLRPGGEWKSGMLAPDGREFHVRGEYRAIEPPERLVFTHVWVEEEGPPPRETVVVVSLREEEGKTIMTFEQSGFRSQASRDSHRDGWGEAFANLEAHLGQHGRAIAMTC